MKSNHKNERSNYNWSSGAIIPEIITKRAILATIKGFIEYFSSFTKDVIEKTIENTKTNGQINHVQ